MASFLVVGWLKFSRVPGCDVKFFSIKGLIFGMLRHLKRLNFRYGHTFG